MKSSLQLLLLTVFGAEAHYGFPFIVVNGVVSKRWEYTRPATYFGPNFDYDQPSAMCGVNATLPLFPIKTLKIAAGSVIGFAANYMTRVEPYDESKHFEDWDPSFVMYHTGPASAWLSKAPDGKLDEYKGDEDWFKIDVKPASDGLHWDYNSGAGINIMNFTIPKATPPGKYLLRGEHLNMENGGFYKSTEMYLNCVHVEVTGEGTGTPSPTVKFPWADAKDSGIWLPQALFRPYQPMDELKNWQGAGPKVWRG